MGTMLAIHGNIINSQEPLPIPVDILTLLWENENPFQEFTPKDITLASDDYDFLLVYFYEKYTETYRIESVIMPKMEQNYQGRLTIPFTGSNGTIIAQRTVTFNSYTSLSFNNGEIAQGSTGSSVDNARVIPYQIYGFKKHVPMQDGGGSGAGYIAHDINDTLGNSCATIAGYVTGCNDAILIMENAGQEFHLHLTALTYNADNTFKQAGFSSISVGVGPNFIVMAIQINSSSVIAATSAGITGPNTCASNDIATAAAGYIVKKILIM